GDDRGHDPPAGAAVPRARDAEPDRVRGHLSAPGSAARPLPAPNRGRLPGARGGVGRAGASPRARGRRDRARAGGRTGRAARDAAGRRAGARRPQRRAVHGRSRGGDKDRVRGTGRGEPARVARFAEALALPGRTRRARLRDAGRREVGCGARALAPAFAAPRALGAAAPARRHRARAARPGADAEGRARARARGGVTRTATPKLGAYTALAGVGLLAALVVGRPELAALAAPFALVLVVGLSFASDPRIQRAAFELDRERALEDETVEAALILRTEEPIGRLELLLDLPDGLNVDGANAQIVRLDWRQRRELDFTLRCARWGGYMVGDFVLRSPEVF